MTNQICVITPYWHYGSLVFDDPRVGLEREPFVAGADTALAKIAEAEEIEGRHRGFTVLFSASEFPGSHAVMERQEPDQGGYWYWCERVKVRGWLCPALYKYFTEAPERLFIQVKEARLDGTDRRN